MIVPGLTEEKILEELIYDREDVALEARKAAKKMVSRLQKEGRDGIDKSITKTIDVKTKHNNNWVCNIFVNMVKKPYWYHSAVCVVESDQGTQDYYLVRGFSVDKPYYIKMSTHTIKRIKERLFKEIFNATVEMRTAEFIPFLIKKGEIIPYMRIADTQLLEFVLDSKDNHTLSTLFYTFLGSYLGYETPGGNFEFKTFLRNDVWRKNPKEIPIMTICECAYICFNPSYHDKSLVEKAKEKDLTGFVDHYNLKLMP